MPRPGEIITLRWSTQLDRCAFLELPGTPPGGVRRVDVFPSLPRPETFRELTTIPPPSLSPSPSSDQDETLGPPRVSTRTRTPTPADSGVRTAGETLSVRVARPLGCSPRVARVGGFAHIPEPTTAARV